MRHRKLSLLTLLAILGFTLVIRSQQPKNSANLQKQKEQPEEVDVSEFPILDYAAEKQVQGAERIKRDKRGKKYNSKYSPVINEGQTESPHSLIGSETCPHCRLKKATQSLLVK